MKITDPNALFFQEKYNRINDKINTIHICQRNLPILKQLIKLQGKCELLIVLNMAEGFSSEEKNLLKKINNIYFKTINDGYEEAIKLIKNSDNN